MSQNDFEDFLDNWLIRQFTYARGIDVTMLRERMLDAYESDPDFWQAQPLWALHDAAGGIK